MPAGTWKSKPRGRPCTTTLSLAKQLHCSVGVLSAYLPACTLQQGGCHVVVLPLNVTNMRQKSQQSKQEHIVPKQECQTASSTFCGATATETGATDATTCTKKRPAKEVQWRSYKSTSQPPCTSQGLLQQNHLDSDSAFFSTARSGGGKDFNQFRLTWSIQGSQGQLDQHFLIEVRT